MHSVKRSKALLFFILLLQVVGFSAALGADTPTLTWERGRQQTITLGGDTATKLWKLTLVNSAGESVPLNRSSANSAGFYMYSIDLADDFKVGEYSVKTQGPDMALTIVAHISVIPQTNYNPLQDPRGVGSLAVVAFTVLTLFSGTSKPEKAEGDTNGSDDLGESNQEPTNEGSVGGVDTKFEDTKGENGPDRISYMGMAFVQTLDNRRYFLLQQVSKSSRILTGVIANGAYLQALLGPVSLLLPIAGFVIGISMGLTSDFSSSLVPTSFALFLSVIALGIFDSMSGLIAITTFSLCALVQGRVNSLVDLRTMLGLIFISFTPILAASAIRPLRRLKRQWNLWERVSDVLIAALLSGWAVKAMVVALDGFSHQKNPVVTHSNLIGLVAGALIAIRYLLEELSLRLAGKRLAFLTPPPPPTDSFARFMKNLSVKAAIFLLFMYGFFGLSWQIFVVVLILLLPTYLARFSSKFPNFPALFQFIPAGLPGLLFLSLMAIVLNHWVNSLPLLASDKTRTIAVILSLPAFILSLLRLFGRSPSSGDVRWYCREKFSLIYKLGGPVIFLLTMAVTGGAIS